MFKRTRASPNGLLTPGGKFGKRLSRTDEVTIPGMQAAEPISKYRNGIADKEIADSTHVYGH